jgi:hypothetical protein
MKFSEGALKKGVASLAEKNSYRMQFGAKTLNKKIVLSHPGGGW